MPSRTDAELLACLRDLIAAGEVTLRLDPDRLGHLDSPVAVQAESTRWFAALAAVVLAAAWFGGWLVGGAALLASIAIWFAVVRPWVARRLHGRVETKALAEVELWRRLWKLGGVALAPRAGDPCAAPGGNWMQFVRDRRPAALPPSAAGA